MESPLAAWPAGGLLEAAAASRPARGSRRGRPVKPESEPPTLPPIHAHFIFFCRRTSTCSSDRVLPQCPPRLSLDLTVASHAGCINAATHDMLLSPAKAQLSRMSSIKFPAPPNGLLTSLYLTFNILRHKYFCMTDCTPAKTVCEGAHATGEREKRMTIDLLQANNDARGCGSRDEGRPGSGL
jgi:hypothetical protein